MCITLTKHLEWAKVKCKYAKQNLKHDLLFDDTSNVCSISHHLRDIRKSNKISKF